MTLLCVRHLCWQVRAAIALTRMKLKPKEVADLLGCPSGREMYRFVRKLRASDNPMVRKAWLEGLPPDASFTLPGGQTVKCEACGSLLQAVPCIVCAMPAGREASPAKLNGVSSAENATGARPGTSEKIKVLRERAMRRESLYHEADAGYWDQVYCGG